MAKVDIAQLAEILGKTNDAAFAQAVNAAVADLERLLKYPLCGSTEPELRTFTYRPGYLWLKTHPFYDLESLVIVRNGNEETVSTSDLQYGQNGELYGSWFNGIKECKPCRPGCACFDGCEYVKITAKWGFCPPVEADTESPGDESPGEPVTYCCLPDDLYNVLVEAIKQATDPRSDVQSENVGTRSYSKFTSSFKSVWDKYSSVINFYAMREPRI